MSRLDFEFPAQVLRSDRLDLEQKCAILRQWVLDERALLVADDEGMSGGRAPCLGEVRRALRALGAVDGAGSSSPAAPCAEEREPQPPRH